MFKFAIVDIDSPSLFFTSRNKDLASRIISRVVFTRRHGDFTRHISESISHLVARSGLGVLFIYTTKFYLI